MLADRSAISNGFICGAHCQYLAATSSAGPLCYFYKLDVSACLVLSEALAAQESHCTPIQALAFNHVTPDYHNLFATIGKDQVGL